MQNSKQVYGHRNDTHTKTQKFSLIIMIWEIKIQNLLMYKEIRTHPFLNNSILAFFIFHILNVNCKAFIIHYFIVTKILPYFFACNFWFILKVHQGFNNINAIVKWFWWNMTNTKIGWFGAWKFVCHSSRSCLNVIVYDS